VLSAQVGGGDAERLGVPAVFGGSGEGTFADAVAWSPTSALVLALALSVAGAGGPLVGGTAVIEVNALGQAEYAGVDGWVPVIPMLTWITGQTPFLLAGLLGGAPLTTVASAGSPRLRVRTTGLADVVQVRATVVPVAADPACP